MKKDIPITLSTELTSLIRKDAQHIQALKTLQLKTVRDLLFYFPTRYADIAELKNTRDIAPDQHVTLYGKLKNVDVTKGWKSKIPMTKATLEDELGHIQLIWFNQAYIGKMYPEGSLVKISGKVTQNKTGFSIANPDISRIQDMPIDTHDSLFAENTESASSDTFLTPVYRETKGISSRFLHILIKKCLSHKVHTHVRDPIPPHILQKYALPNIDKALMYMHVPKKEEHVVAARKRFAFEEIFLIQIRKQQERALLLQTKAYAIHTSDLHDKQKKSDPLFMHALSFLEAHGIMPTGAQKRAIEAIIADIEQTHPMSRLLEGDVGSGKTAVAAACAYMIITTRPSFINEKGSKIDQTFGTLQVAYMAPTEILATQHFESFCELFKHTGISIALITGSTCLKFPSKSNKDSAVKLSKTQVLKWVKNGEISIVVGTHALIQKTVSFKHLGLVIVDEQHRFGIKQRKALAEKANDFGNLPHLLSMTATPIPRTLALTIYGDLDLTILDEMPPGRKKVTTKIIPSHAREKMYDAVQSELEAGRQVYVICSRIDDSEDEEDTKPRKSVVSEATRLQKNVFQKYKVGVLHGKMKPQEKDVIMNSFKQGDIDILVSTTVIEVGVNVPNASIIIIEDADRFGLAQLHQLRGRVLRGTHTPYCYICSESTSESSFTRLQALESSSDGFALAEKDLHLRGAGKLTGSKQSGISDIGMEAIKNVKLVEAARAEAKNILQENTLSHYPDLEYTLLERDTVHFE